MQQIGRAGHDRDSALIAGLVIFDGAGLGFRIQMRRHAPDDLNRTHAMGDGHDGISVNALALRPLPPLAVHRAGRVDENSVQIKKNG